MRWKDRVWTDIIKKALNSGHVDDDVIFSDTTAGIYYFSVAIMDNERQGPGGLTHITYTNPITLIFTITGATTSVIPRFNLILILGIEFAISVISIKLRKSIKNK
jgi:hypothetical protein